MWVGMMCMHVWPQIQLWEAHITSAIAALAVLHNSTTTSNSTHAQILQRSAAKAKALISTGLHRSSSNIRPRKRSRRRDQEKCSEGLDKIHV